MDNDKYLDLRIINEWQKSFWVFAKDCLKMGPALPKSGLAGKTFSFDGPDGRKREVKLFDADGFPCHGRFKTYTPEMFQNQGREEFKIHGSGRFTWQQTLAFQAYQNAIETFDQPTFDIAKRFITIRSGHGTGKTAFLSCVSLHFLLSFFGAQVGATANTEDQLKDIFLKEFYFWNKRLPEQLQAQVDQQDDHIRISGEKDWFLRARVSRPEKPEALAGLHGKYVLIMADEASGISNRVFEVMKGALTGERFIVIYTSNPTRAEGEFFDSHRKGARYTQLHFDSRQSPIVKEGFIQKIIDDYGEDSEEFEVRVAGNFPKVVGADDKGWMPLFANVTVNYQNDTGQVLVNPIMGVDPAGLGRDKAIGAARDNLYLKLVIDRETCTEKELAAEVETVMLAYGIPPQDVGMDAFGMGARVLANMDSKIIPILADVPREDNEAGKRERKPSERKFNSWRSEMAWNFMLWVRAGGIIITDNPVKWKRLFERIKFKRDLQGRICLMPKVEYKKLYGSSCDEFDAAIYTFFKEHGTAPVHLTKAQREEKENLEFLQKVQGSVNGDTYGDRYSSM